MRDILSHCELMHAHLILIGRLLLLYSVPNITPIFFVYMFFVYICSLFTFSTCFLGICLYKCSFHIMYICPCNSPELEQIEKLYCIVLLLGCSKYVPISQKYLCNTPWPNVTKLKVDIIKEQSMI